MRFLFFFLFSIVLYAADFDCVVVGTSPFSLFEALYRAHSGCKVLVLEADCNCGGSWQSVNACGIEHADLGCHQIGHDNTLKCFLEEYAGCKIVSLDRPLDPYSEPSASPNGFYFSRGCFELIDNLLRLLSKTDAVLLLNQRVESVLVDPTQTFVTFKTKTQEFTASKCILTNMSSFGIENLGITRNTSHSKFYHLYLLIQDPTEPKFCYTGGVGHGISRMMNLTHLVGLTNTGQQLVVIQTHSEQALSHEETIINEMKAKDCLGESAYILKSEPRIYEQSHNQIHQIQRLPSESQKLFDIINTGHFQSLSTYIPKWKRVLMPYAEAIR